MYSHILGPVLLLLSLGPFHLTRPVSMPLSQVFLSNLRPAYSTTCSINPSQSYTDNSTQTCPKLNSSPNLVTNLIASFREFHHLIQPNFSASLSNSVDFMFQESLGSIFSSLSPLLLPWVRFTAFPPGCLDEPPSSSNILAVCP